MQGAEPGTRANHTSQGGSTDLLTLPEELTSQTLLKGTLPALHQSYHHWYVVYRKEGDTYERLALLSHREVTYAGARELYLRKTSICTSFFKQEGE